jgi:hypothetical protein
MSYKMTVYATGAVVLTLLSAQAGHAQSSGGSTTKNDAACAIACGVVNKLDRVNKSTPAVVRQPVQKVINEARESVNKTCSNSCEKPKTTGARRGS